MKETGKEIGKEMGIEVTITKQLHNFSMQMEFASADGRIGILGASGCGKSMTLKCIAGIETPDAGRIVVNGRVLFDAERRINVRPQERNIGYLFQNYALFPTMTVRENIMVGLTGKRKGNQEKAIELMRQLEIEELAGRYPGELSGGQQQRVALARILAYEPDVILLDEPFSALDAYLKESLLREVKEILAGYQGQVIVVSHSRDEIYSLCHSLLVMEQGQMVRQGETKEVFRNPKVYEAAKLTGCKNISPMEKLGEHELYAREWNLILHTEEKVLEEHRYVGIRAHEIIPVFQEQETGCKKNNFPLEQETGCQENTFPLELVDQSEAPFEMWYMIRQKLSKEMVTGQSGMNQDGMTGCAQAPVQSGLLWWKIGKQLNEEVFAKGMPQQFHIPKQSILLLT